MNELIPGKCISVKASVCARRGPIYGLSGTIWGWAVLMLLSASIPSRADSADQAVRQYYESVLRNEVPGTSELRGELPDTVMTPAIGWTASGDEFVNVLSGEIDCETREVVFLMKPHGVRSRRALGDRFMDEIVVVKACTIRSTDLPEYHEYIGRPRTGFTVIGRDEVFLDARYHANPMVIEEAFEHEVMHVLDRDLYAILSPEDLEVRGMIRGFSRGRIPVENLERLIYAKEEGEPRYRDAAARILEAIALIVGVEARAENLRKVDPNHLRSAARVCEIIMGL